MSRRKLSKADYAALNRATLGRRTPPAAKLAPVQVNQIRNAPRAPSRGGKAT